MKIGLISVQPPLAPGEILVREFMRPLGLTQQELAAAMKVSYQRVNQMVNGDIGITPDSAIRLGKVFGVSPEFWLLIDLRNSLWKALNENSERSSEYSLITQVTNKDKP